VKGQERGELQLVHRGQKSPRMGRAAGRAELPGMINVRYFKIAFMDSGDKRLLHLQSDSGSVGAENIERSQSTSVSVNPGDKAPTAPLAVGMHPIHRITESQNSRGWKGPLWVI